MKTMARTLASALFTTGVAMLVACSAPRVVDAGADSGGADAVVMVDASADSEAADRVVMIDAVSDIVDDDGSRCPSGQVLCGSACASTDSDRANCGTCG